MNLPMAAASGCYFDQFGKKHREKVGLKSTAISVYQQRKTEIRQGRKKSS